VAENKYLLTKKIQLIFTNFINYLSIFCILHFPKQRILEILKTVEGQSSPLDL